MWTVIEKNKNVAYVEHAMLLSHKKNAILLYATTWMNLESIVLNEISEREKDRYMISLICGIFK